MHLLELAGSPICGKNEEQHFAVATVFSFFLLNCAAHSRVSEKFLWDATYACLSLAS